MQIFNLLKEQEALKEPFWPPEYPFDPAQKQTHYWIYGGRNTGKTTMLERW